MKLALRKSAPTGANAMQKAFCWAIRERLVSDFCHGGIVIDGALYHSTIARGPHKLEPGEWTPSNWDLFEFSGDDAQAISNFEEACKPPDGWWRRLWWKITKGYDAFSLIAFVGPFVRVSWLHYCFELCGLMMTSKDARVRVTPESLLLLTLART